MGIIQDLKEGGIKRMWEITYQIRIDKIIRMVIAPFLLKKPLLDILVIESHNDFDCNGGAFYDYLLKNNYNKKWKIVWLVKNSLPTHLPENVIAVPLFKPNLKKDYYICRAKIISTDCVMVKKERNDQRVYYLSHSAGGMKDVRGKIVIPDYVDFVLTQSHNYAKIQAEQYSMTYPNDRMIFLGFPTHDILLNSDSTELNKLTKKKYKKTIVWMPTFRRGGGFKRNDSDAEQPLGIPLIGESAEYEKMNDFLKENDTLMIIKIHPMQDLSTLKISNKTNIIVLTAQDAKKKNVDNYKLIKCADALISDYSGIAHDYLLLNRPIAYVLADLHEYNRGFVVEDIRSMMPGHHIYQYSDMKDFIIDVINGNDIYVQKRREMSDWFFEYHDNNNCKRLAEHMHLS